VVEGNFDCISVYMAGLHNVIASSGTAFSEAQVRLLGRFSKNIIVNFDPDTAGAAATERSLAMLVEEEFNIRVVQLDAGLDPDLYIRDKGADAYKQEIRDSKKYFHYLIDRAQQQFGKVSDGKVKAVNYLLPHIQRVPSRITRDELASDVAQRLGIDSAVLRQELKTAVATRAGQPIKSSTLEQNISPAEKTLIRVLISSAGEREKVVEALSSEHLHEGWAGQEIFCVLLAADAVQLEQPLALPFPDVARNQVAAILMDEEEVPGDMEIQEALSAMRRRQLERAIQQLQPKIDEAGRKGETALLAKLSSEKLNLKRALDESMRRDRSVPAPTTP
jgi:DNA primase